MTRSLIERRLCDVTDTLERARQELSLVEEQLESLIDSADDARLRALVAETPLANRDNEVAQRHADAMTRSRGAVAASIAELERAQDELLARWVAEAK